MKLQKFVILTFYYLGFRIGSLLGKYNLNIHEIHQISRDMFKKVKINGALIYFNNDETRCNELYLFYS